MAALYQEAGIRTFNVVPIAPPGGAPLGALLVGSREPRVFASDKQG
jgi:hypothetical protein